METHMNIEKHRAFIDSLEGEKGLPEGMHEWRFDEPLNELSHAQPGDAWRFRDYMIERCRRAESRQIPDLKERVKELVRAYSESERTRTRSAETQREWNEFRALCEPEKDNRVKP